MSVQQPAQRSATSERGLGPFGPPLLLIAVMWVTELIDTVLRGSLDAAGIEARDTDDGLLGILAAPFLHGGWGHLLSNTVPMLLLGTLVAMHGTALFWRVTALVVVLGGLGTWLIAPSGSVTIGASGVVFGYLTYLLAAGLRTGYWRDLLVGLGVLLLYGGLLVGALPWAVASHVSWQAHLCGGIAGLVAAWWWPPPRRAGR